MASPDQQQEYFGVRLVGPVRFAIPLMSVEAVLRVNPKDICPIPGVKPYMLGVISQKGALVWVFNMAHFLQMSQDLPTTVSFVATVLKSSVRDSTVEGGRRIRRLACVVSELEGIYPLERNQLQPLPTQFNNRFRSLFSALAFRAPILSTPLSTVSTSTEPVRVAVLETESLLELVYRESTAFSLNLDPLQVQEPSLFN